MMKRLPYVACTVLGVVLASASMQGWANPPVPTLPATTKSPEEIAELARHRAELAAAPIRSKADLDTYLARTPPAQSAFAPLSPEGYRLFVNGLRFNERGIAGFRIEELHRELTPEQVHKLLALFGYEYMADDIAGVNDGSANDPRRPTPSPEGPIAKAMIALEAVQRDEELSQAASMKKMVAIYTRDIAPLITPERIGRVSSNDLQEAVEGATLYLASSTNDARYPTDARRALDELVRRKKAAPDDFRHVVAGFVYVRDIPAARAVSLQGDLPTTSLVDIEKTDGTGRGLIELDATAHHLVTRRFDINKHGTQIIVVSSARCHFTIDAAEAIDANPVLKAGMAGKSVWIVPPDTDLALAAVEAWNLRHPAEHMALIASVKDWPEIDTRATPQFFVFKDGVLQQTIEGWKGKETEDALLKVFNAG
jgi:hypothetical protein